MSDKELVSFITAILLYGRKYNNIDIGGVVADAFQITLMAEKEILQYQAAQARFRQEIADATADTLQRIRDTPRQT